ncbi:MAG: 3-phosphoshikimate 1-carboxyvinyltransferase [Clostridia bacterium]|nr:3-phosphoshikimate 1-carboxyvinyltransferase [Clostridia bacterium]
MDIVVSPKRLHGNINAIISKSDAHRKLICASLSRNRSLMKIYPPFCEDINATISCLEALGAEFEQTKDGLKITPIDLKNRAGSAVLDCKESGSTFRFLLPVASAILEESTFKGEGRLPKRPISVLANEMKKHLVTFSSDTLPFTINGLLTGGYYEIPGNISSQFLSGLLMALPFCKEDSKIFVNTKLESASYVDMTLEVLRSFGAKIDTSQENIYRIKGNQELTAPDIIYADSDWSNAAFWLVANKLGADIKISGLNFKSTQGDKEVYDILSKSEGKNLPKEINMENIPDLLPILAICAANSDSDTKFINAQRLRLKESDRLKSTVEMIKALGGKAEETSDGIIVYNEGLKGGTVDSVNDHRIVMSAAIASSVCSLPVKILGAQAVNKSYPEFLKDYEKLGGSYSVINIREEA